MSRAIDKFSRRTVAISEHPTAPQQIRKLTIRNLLVRWDHAHLGPHFVEDLIAPVNKMISRAHRLESLFIETFPLNQESISIILALPQLHTVHLACNLGMDTPTSLRCDSVLNAWFSPREDHSTTWRILPSFPSLRWLFVTNSEADGSLPPPDIRAQANIFATLERLTLFNLHSGEVEDLTQWIQQAVPPNGPGLRLTQVKLIARLGINEKDIRMIISALHSAPIQDLVLEGLTYAEPDLLDLISDAFPKLRSLTLYDWDNEFGSDRRESAHWPRASREYALRLTKFECLRHFGWNWKFPKSTPSSSAASILEDTLPAPQLNEDWQGIPRLFSKSCPTLESFVFRNGDIRGQHYILHHAADGGVEVKLQRLSGDTGGITLDDVNPVYWPEFLPSC